MGCLRTFSGEPADSIPAGRLNTKTQSSLLGTEPGPVVHRLLHHSRFIDSAVNNSMPQLKAALHG